MEDATDSLDRPIAIARRAGLAVILFLVLIGVLVWLISRVEPSDVAGSTGTLIFLGSIAGAVLVVALGLYIGVTMKSKDPMAHCAVTCLVFGWSVIACLEAFIASVETHSVVPYAIVAGVSTVIFIGVWPRRRVWNARLARSA